ncbi:mechanosensitive ion channel [Methylomonas sp. MO1]|uniref:mechanosensitive ion channel domain-containing protein n=1 Tax=Methylomonas sp. MO1 TaxID=3073619 RepID=UPI0028A446CD|nr:mechanosensitive ion channel domain-containing protein [Methylomonas sp. MO1]MDT4290354.1 mechanosensitive ion channel [Methylomonas sp. MO1]
MTHPHEQLPFPRGTMPCSPRLSGTLRCARFAVVAAMLSLPALSACAQGSPVSKPSATARSANQDTPSLQARETALKSRLDQVRTRLIALSKDGAVAPVAATETEWAEYTRLLNLIVNDYEQHLDTLRKFRGMGQTREDFQKKAMVWTNFSEPPPYSVDFIDYQWQQVRLKDHELEATRLEQTLFDGLLETRRQEYLESAQNLRQANEALEAARPEQAERARWLQELNALRTQRDEARIGLLSTSRDLRNERLAHLADEKALLLQQAMEASSSSPLSQADLNKKLDQLTKRQLELDGEIALAVRAAQTAESQLQSTRERLKKLSEQINLESGAKVEDAKPELERIQQILDADSVESQVASSNLRTLRLLALSVVSERQAWELRYLVGHTEDPVALNKAVVDLKQGMERLSLWRKYLKSELDSIQIHLDNQTKMLADWQSGYGEQKQEQRKKAAFDSEEKLLRRALSELNDLDSSLLNMFDLLALKNVNASLTEKLKTFYADSMALVTAFSDFELLAIDDTIVVEGRQITGKRSVTVSKIFKLIAILAVGLWLVIRVADQGLRRVKNWQPIKASSGLLSLRLFSLVAVVAIIVFALVSVHIPLTVFTFFGGALAIGVGFGAQNIINNFISGLILLAERSIRLGDMVEIEGVLSRVTQIGSRCCQVHRLDGIDMLIPNSRFLENNVTNLTLSDQRLRCTITLGIAYGSQVRKALALVETAAIENPQVLKQPAPDIYLQEFADSALSLRLDFWVDLLVQPNRMRLMSDVRLRIEELFSQHGILLAFPQRDVHLDITQPVRVELNTAMTSGGAAA